MCQIIGHCWTAKKFEWVTNIRGQSVEGANISVGAVRRAGILLVVLTARLDIGIMKRVNYWSFEEKTFVKQSLGTVLEILTNILC